MLTVHSMLVVSQIRGADSAPRRMHLYFLCTEVTGYFFIYLTSSLDILKRIF